ncbi:hypothetical protein K5549_012491 [Capra hircus]|nr:hypothetical protein K5549_012491 [Capra hircus]
MKVYYIHNSALEIVIEKVALDSYLGYDRSTDYGTTYEKLNDKVGLKTVLSYLYVNPTNKRKMAPEFGCFILDAPPVFSLLLASPVIASGLMASSCYSL